MTIIKRIMRKISDDVIKQNQMPILDLPKIGYDNTVWSDEKRMLTTGDKKIEVSPDSVKKIPTFAQYLVMANAVKNYLMKKWKVLFEGCIMQPLVM